MSLHFFSSLLEQWCGFLNIEQTNNEEKRLDLGVLGSDMDKDDILWADLVRDF